MSASKAIFVWPHAIFVLFPWITIFVSLSELILIVCLLTVSMRMPLTTLSSTVWSSHVILTEADSLMALSKAVSNDSLWLLAEIIVAAFLRRSSIVSSSSIFTFSPSV